MPSNDYYSKNRKQIGFLSFFRDILIFRTPLIGRFFARATLPYSPDFIFLTHPRNQQDIEATFPFVRLLMKFFPDSWVKCLLKMAPCYVVANVCAPKNKVGYVVSVVELPDKMFASRELTRRLVKGCCSYFEKISPRLVYVGLAAWWPIVSNSGRLFLDHLDPSSNVKVTNGHTATLASIYLSVIDLLGVFNRSQGIETNERLLIIGAGKIGGGLASLISSKVKKIGLIDKNKTRLNALEKLLKLNNANLVVESILINEENAEEVMCEKISEYVLVACTTSNAGLLISESKKIKNCIILDDSRPEAFPRFFSPSSRAVVLEGGLMKVAGVNIDSDFGFGQSDNIFGCLSEAIILALDENQLIKPNTGELDEENFWRLVDFCGRNRIVRGDFKYAHKDVPLEVLTNLFMNQ